MRHEFRFRRQVDLPTTAADAWAWHARPGAFDRLAPPWQRLVVIRRNAELVDGSELEFRVVAGPVCFRWLARHEAVRPGKGFVDTQLKGPFASWRHDHRFDDTPHGTCRMTDALEYRLPLASVSHRLAGQRLADDLDALFAWRHCTTLDDLTLHATLGRRFGDRPRRVAISGLSGTIGTTLAAILSTGGHEVIQIVRSGSSQEAASPDAASPWPTVVWNGDGFESPDLLEGLDAFVDLAGEPIDRRWTAARRQRIAESRGPRVRAVVRALGDLTTPPRAFLCASGVGVHGDTGREGVDESHPLEPADGFLTGVARDWESAAIEAERWGARVVPLRFGVVLSPRAGALDKLLGPVPLGPLVIPGDGKQRVSWVTADDAAAAVMHAIHDETLDGPIHVTAPDPMPMADLVEAIAEATDRPILGRLPTGVLRLGFGAMADETVLASIAARPRRLLDAGFAFRHAEPVDALRLMLGRGLPSTSGRHAPDASREAA